MANTRDIRRRIKSVKNTSQITKAMEMVAASKMRRAQQAAVAGRPYSEVLNEVLVSLRDHVDKESHPLLAQRDVHKTLVILLTSDKGLCGALNTNVLRDASLLDTSTTLFVAVGRKGASFLARTGRQMIADFTLPDNPAFLQTKPISQFCLEQFLSGAVDQVNILYPKFINTLVQRPVNLQLLPISIEKADGMVPSPNASSSLERPITAEKDSENESSEIGEYLFEPSTQSVLNAILPYSFHFEVFQKILDERASEQSARMVAMKAATDNAKNLVKDLTLEYNKARQASITTELLEITTAQMALG
ncbi:MAG: ATP synthase F1 subunit gamma [Verrucomicrobia bacterium]|jgi:F-type H+-transporting ATPase subunit gamma|nr:MAG: ATP synthase F1 subunit gamma [Verrucomicrobiota bacterium]MDH4470234.1 ATP synthase F1 subunit gamma [Verrucomicrobiae bacterium]